MRPFCYLFDGVFVKLPLLRTVGDIGGNGVIEQDDMLANIGDMFSQAGQLDVAGINTVQQDSSRCRVLEALQQVDECGFTTA